MKKKIKISRVEGKIRVGWVTPIKQFFFLGLSDELQCFPFRLHASNKTLMQSVFQMTNKILCHDREMALEVELSSNHGTASLSG